MKINPVELYINLIQLNEDVFRIVIGFLEIRDLLNMQLVSKEFLFSSFVEEDSFWKDFYSRKLIEINGNNHKAKFELPKVESNYKMNYIKSIDAFVKQAEGSFEILVKTLKNSNKSTFFTNSEVMDYKIMESSNKSRRFQIFIVGDGAS